MPALSFLLMHAATSAAREPEWLAVPPGGGWLKSGAGGEPRLTQGPPAAAAAFVQPVFTDGKPPALMATRVGPGCMRVNGAWCGAAAVLHEKDELLVPDVLPGPLFVTLFAEPFLGPPPAELVGQPCGFCKVPFEGGTRLYRCPCGAALHAESASDADDPLDCVAQLATCRSCGLPLLAEPGLTWTPEDLK